MKPYLTFIIPVYKVEESFLRYCIESLIRIKAEDVEFVLIDDGSPDNSGKICDEYRSIDNRIIVVHKDNEGVSIARNTGISVANGKYVTFIDSDDWLDSSKMEEIIERTRKQECDLYVYGQYINYKNNEIAIFPFESDRFFEGDEIEKLKAMVFVRGYDSLGSDINSGVMCNAVDKIIKKEIIESNSITFDSKIKMGEDALFNLRIVDCCRKIQFISINAYHYRMRQSSVNHSNRELGYGNGNKLFMDQALAYLKSKNASEQLFDAAYYRCFNLIFEQFDNAYLNSSGYSITKKCKSLAVEMQTEPYKTAIRRIKLRELGKKEKIKAIVLKLHLLPVFLILKEFGRKIGINENKEFY